MFKYKFNFNIEIFIIYNTFIVLNFYIKIKFKYLSILSRLFKYVDNNFKRINGSYSYYLTFINEQYQFYSNSNNRIEYNSYWVSPTNIFFL